MKGRTVLLGFRIPTGDPVEIPVRHLCVTGQTQEAGKTTTLEALIARSGLRAIVFRTKRAEGAFLSGRSVQPYFRERADWQFVSAILEATLRERLKFERSWIMRASKGARTLRDVQRNVRTAMTKAKGLSADVYFTLDEYLSMVVPEIERAPFAETLHLEPGINVMDLVEYSSELQSLVIASVLEWIYEREHDTVTVIPEAWEFLPQQRRSPVVLAGEQLIRKGAASRNYVWLDSQDIAGVTKNVLRSVAVWILGVQREVNEVKRTLAHIPAGVGKPKVGELMQLGKGEFFACFGGQVVKTYVQPLWLTDDVARLVATGKLDVETVQALGGAAAFKRAIERSGYAGPLTKPEKGERHVTEAEAAALKRQNEDLREQLRRVQAELEALKDSRAPAVRAAPAAKASAGEPFADDAETLYQRFKARLMDEAPALLRVLADRPELRVEVERRVIEAGGKTLRGRLAILIAERFFDEAKTGNAAWNELQRRGVGSAKPNVYREADKLAADGFLTKEADGYRSVAGMKINVVEAA